MYRVIDDLVSNRYSQFIFDEMVKLKWTFVPNLSYSTSNDTDNCGFSYSYYLNKKYSHSGEEILANEFNYIKPLLFEAYDKFGINLPFENLFRSRARLTVQKSSSVIEEKHVDYSFPHLVILYYVNSTDGDTIFFDGDKIIERITPRRGRCVLFDGRITHASSSSTIMPRIVINNNILI